MRVSIIQCMSVINKLSEAAVGYIILNIYLIRRFLFIMDISFIACGKLAKIEKISDIENISF